MKNRLNKRDNPFMQNGYMLPMASINRHMVDGVPSNHVFSPRLIAEEVRKHSNIFHLNKQAETKAVFFALEQGLASFDPYTKDVSIKICEQFCAKLFKILSTLIWNNPDSVLARDEWNSNHWTHWRTVKQVILVGGYLLPNIAERFQDCMNQMLENTDSDFQVRFIPNSGHSAIEGLRTRRDGESLFFDFGQTMIKRAYQDSNSRLHKLESYPTDFLGVESTAKQLDEYIGKVIMDTVVETKYEGHIIDIAVSNYITENGFTASRIGYGKLALLSDRYDNHLKLRLIKSLGKEYMISFMHDASAMALNYINQKDTVLISLGTAFGVSFIK